MEEYFKNAVAFYYKDLVDKGCDDPMQVIIASFVNTVRITKEQQDFIMKMTNKDVRMIDNIIVLISKMKKDKKYNERNLDLIEKGLSHLKNGK